MTTRVISATTALAIVLVMPGKADGPAARRAVQTDSPCALLTTAEVQRAFPGSKAGTLDRSNEKYGLVSCIWHYPTGVFSIISGDETLEPVKEEARGWTLVFLDPLKSGAERNVRYETLTGVGDQAIAIIEREDSSKGFIQNGAILVVRRGQRQVSAMSTDLARRDRAAALKVFEDLGKAIAGRLPAQDRNRDDVAATSLDDWLSPARTSELGARQ